MLVTWLLVQSTPLQVKMVYVHDSHVEKKANEFQHLFAGVTSFHDPLALL